MNILNFKIISTIIVLGILSFCLTYFVIKISIYKNIFNFPNERSLHKEPTSRLGGISIVITWYLGISLLFYWKLIERELFYALLCGIIIAIVSFVDDLKSLPLIFRLFIHFTTALLSFYFIGGLRHFIFPGFEINYLILVYPFVIIGIVWFINLFNFMDGVDGLASNEAITIATILFIFSGDVINLVLIACILGFLFWNLPNAKIFMGDLGSTQLGFILIILGIYFHNNLDFSILNWIMLAAPFWFDATFTVLRRWIGGENIGKPHKKHAYQRLVLSGFSHAKTNIILISINTIIFPLILLYREYNFLKVPITILTLLTLFLLYRRVDKKIPF